MFTAKKEARVLQLIRDHVYHVDQCLQSCKKLFDRYVENDAAACESLWQEVQHWEHQADLLRRDVYEGLGKGAFLPLVRADLHHLVDTLDEVAGVAEDLTDKLVCERPVLPANVVPLLQSIFEKTVQQWQVMLRTVELFLQDHKTVNPAVVSGKQEVLSAEHEIDTLEHDLTRMIFSSGLALAEKVHLKQLLSQLAEISNKIEDVADRLSEIMVKLQV